MKSFSVHTTSRESLIDITMQVEQIVNHSGIPEGICVVFIPHTTAAVTLNENADPSVKTDLIQTLKRLLPQSPHYQHREGNSDAHIKSSLTGSSILIIVENGRLRLGTWQGIQFCEFDGPRNREVWVHVAGQGPS
jgi:secondary thiamine-phosphate synthase enzyme